MNFASLLPLDPTFAAPFAFREVGGDILITNRGGNYYFLTPDEFGRFATGKLERTSSVYLELAKRQFIASELNHETLAAQVRNRKTFLRHGPNLHILVVTLRCNETCIYCHSSRAPLSATNTDMTQQTADKVLDLVFASSSPDLTIEFQGGEPLLQFELIRHIVEAAIERNAGLGKRLQFALVSNLSLMDDEKLRFLMEHRVQICTSLDGPAALHDKQRVLVERSAHALTAQWVKRINESYAAAGLDPVLYHVEALLTTTRATLGMAREVVDAYVELGCRALFLRPVDPFGMAVREREALSYSGAEFLDYYRQAVDYLLELNRHGTQVLERFASIFLTKVLSGSDPNYLDIRSPCGAGIGQVAYNYDGAIYTCDEGRMLAEMGDTLFQIGTVGQSSYRDLMQHPTVASTCVASNIDVSPDCVHCTYQPYCGLCPVFNYATQGSLHGRMRDNRLCLVYKGIQDYLFDKLQHGTTEDKATLERWTTARERTHFVHGNIGRE